MRKQVEHAVQAADMYRDIAGLFDVFDPRLNQISVMRKALRYHMVRSNFGRLLRQVFQPCLMELTTFGLSRFSRSSNCGCLDPVVIIFDDGN
jgi:hypothetical protein